MSLPYLRKSLIMAQVRDGTAGTSLPRRKSPVRGEEALNASSRTALATTKQTFIVSPKLLHDQNGFLAPAANW